MNASSVGVGEGKGTSAGFFVDTQGHCFLCLNKISSTVTPTYSLQYLSRYLRLSLRRVLSEEMQLSPEVVAKLGKGRLNAKLCEGCSLLNGRFSELYGQLEKIRMEVEQCLGGIRKKLVQAVESGTAEELHCRMMAENSLDQILKLQVAEALRNEAIQKCSNKLGSTQPRVLVEKLKLNRMSSVLTDGLSPSPSESCTELDNGEYHETEGADITSHPDDNPSIPKLECDICNLEVDDLSTHLYTAHFDVKQEVEVCAGSVKESEPVKPQSSSPRSDHDQNYIFNFTTRKHQCLLCQGEFSSKLCWSTHYRSVHQKLRHKCLLCDKGFTYGSALFRHRKQFHSAAKLQSQNEITEPFVKEPESHTSQEFPPTNPPPPSTKNRRGQLSKNYIEGASGRLTCRICLKEYSSRATWYFHYKGVHQKVRHRCNQCGKTFSHTSGLRVHHNSVHLGKRFQCQTCFNTFKYSTKLSNHYQTSLECRKETSKQSSMLTQPENRGEPGKMFPPSEPPVGTRSGGTLVPGRGISRRQFRFIPAIGKYRCQVCDGNFDDLTTWNVHFKSVHQTHKLNPNQNQSHNSKTNQTKRNSECADCGRDFETVGGLQAHRESVHLGIRYRCGACQTIFSHKGGLQLHQRKHCRKNSVFPITQEPPPLALSGNHNVSDNYTASADTDPLWNSQVEEHYPDGSGSAKNETILS